METDRSAALWNRRNALFSLFIDDEILGLNRLVPDHHEPGEEFLQYDRNTLVGLVRLFTPTVGTFPSPLKYR